VFVDSRNRLYIGGSFSGTGYTGKTALNVANSSGSAKVYPHIRIKGPGKLQSIENLTTGKSIVFDKLVLGSGEYIDMNLDPTNFWMKSSWKSRGNVLRYVLAGSDYGSFHLEPGENLITLYMPSDTTGNTGSWITWQPKFWSVEGAMYV
jgi:hypothetical protein